MPRLHQPLVIMPLEYELLFPLQWNWCKVGETLERASAVIAALGGRFTPTPLEFIRAFAAVTTPNRPPQSVPAQSDGKELEPRVRMFRYCSADGQRLHGKKLELQPGDRSLTSFADLVLIPEITGAMFIPAGFVRSAMSLLRRGIVRVSFLFDGESRDGFSLWGDSFNGESASFEASLKLRAATQEYWLWCRGQ